MCGRCAEAVKSLPGYQFGSVTEEELSQDFELDESVLDAKGQARTDPRKQMGRGASRPCN